MTRAQRIAYDDGYFCGTHGRTTADNPYRRGDPLHWVWKGGLIAGAHRDAPKVPTKQRELVDA